MTATVPQIARAAFFEAHPMLKDVYELPAAVNALIPNDAFAQAGIKKRARVELCTDPTTPASLQIVLFKADTHNPDCRVFTDHETSYLTLNSDNNLVTFVNLNGNKFAEASYPALGTNNVSGLAAYILKKLYAWAGPVESMAMLNAIEQYSQPRRETAVSAAPAKAAARGSRARAGHKP